MADNPDEKSEEKSEADEKPRYVPLVRQRSPNLVVYYANDSLIQHTQWEVQMNFGRMFQPIQNPNEGPPTEARIVQDVIVLMTLEHAEAFRDALAEHLIRARADFDKLREKGRNSDTEQ